MRDHLSLGRRSVGEVPCVEDDMPPRDRGVRTVEADRDAGQHRPRTGRERGSRRTRHGHRRGRGVGSAPVVGHRQHDVEGPRLGEGMARERPRCGGPVSEVPRIRLNRPVGVGRRGSIEGHRISRSHRIRAHGEAGSGRKVRARGAPEEGVRPIPAVVARPIDSNGLEPQAANPRKVDLKILRWRGPGHHAAVEDLPSVAPDLENHAAAAADLVIDADHRRERRTRSIRTELHRGRGPGAEPLGMAGTVQGKGATGLDQTSWPAPLSWTLIAWNAFGSWSTAITSGFVRIARVLASIVRTSLPAMSGADIRAQRPKCVSYSVSDIPPFPTSSMSGSLKPPGAVAAAWRKLRSKIPIMVVQSSLMSSDMRHWWAVTGPHAQGSWTAMLSLALRTIGRPDAAIASRQRA